MNPYGKHPEQPEINDPPPSESGGVHGRSDEVENLPTGGGVPNDEGAEVDGAMPID
jgi:hypothetical protein